MYEEYTLAHHGIKGQKWGVRRFQNADGTLTPEGKRRQVARDNIKRNRDYTDDVNEIVRTLSNKEKKRLGASLHEDWIEKEHEYETIVNKAKTFISNYKDVPASFVEIWTNDSNVGQIALATRSGEEYRGKGLASQTVEKAIKWVERYGNKSIDELEWWARNDNVGSRHLAEKFGFEYDKKTSDENPGWAYYTKKVNK